MSKQQRTHALAKGKGCSDKERHAKELARPKQRHSLGSDENKTTATDLMQRAPILRFS